KIACTDKNRTRGVRATNGNRHERDRSSGDLSLGGRPRRVSLPIRFSARTETRSGGRPGAGNVSRRRARLRKVRWPFVRAELARRHFEKQDRGPFQEGWARDFIHGHGVSFR